MSRKLLLLMLLALLLGTLNLASRVEKAKAAGTIYIRADGSIDPPDAPISTVDNVTYTLTGNIYDSIWVERDNIVVDGTGYSVTGSGWEIGITIIASNLTVRNMKIKNFASGISLQSSSSNCSLFGNEVANNWYGIWVASSSNNVLSGNNATANSECGIRLAQSSNNTLSGNYVTANYVGIWLEYSSNCTLSGNVMEGNRYNFEVDGYVLSDFLHSVDTSNLVDGRPVYYFVNQSDIAVDADGYPEVGYLGFVNCANVTAQGLNLTGNVQGLLFAFTNDSIITDNKVANNLYGIWLSHSSNNTLSGNSVTANNGYGIWLDSFNNTLFGNNITANDICGIWLDLDANSNVFYHNNFVSNGRPVSTWTPSHANSWDDGYPSGGNYWSDHNDTDFYGGSYIQNETGSDGIGDTEYAIDGNNADHYPLMAPISFFDAGSWNDTTYYVHIVSNSTLSHFHFDPDEGAFASFWVKGETVNEALGFCRVAIPKDLLWVEDGWTVLYGSYPLSYKTFSDENYTYLYFTYTNPPSNGFTTATINGTHVITEFPSFLVLSLFMIATLLAIMVNRKKHIGLK